MRAERVHIFFFFFWSHSLTRCQRIDCGPPQPHTNAKIPQTGHNIKGKRNFLSFTQRRLGHNNVWGNNAGSALLIVSE